VVTHIELRRLEWAGHIWSKCISRTPRKIWEGKIYGSWPVGKPKHRWIDVVTRGTDIW